MKNNILRANRGSNEQKWPCLRDVEDEINSTWWWIKCEVWRKRPSLGLF
jgi:hypothetical protein